VGSYARQRLRRNSWTIRAGREEGAKGGVRKPPAKLKRKWRIQRKWRERMGAEEGCGSGLTDREKKTETGFSRKTIAFGSRKAAEKR